VVGRSAPARLNVTNESFPPGTAGAVVDVVGEITTRLRLRPCASVALVGRRKAPANIMSVAQPRISFVPHVDNSVGATYRGRTLADPVRNYGTAFSNMHRELHRIYVDGNVVVVQLALQGTHDGPLQLPFGELPATGKQMNAPCCDVFELEDGKIKRFD
jgi:hypothetical protein